MSSLLPTKSHAYEFWGNKWANPQTLLYYVDSVTINSNYESVSVWGATAWNTSSKVEVTRTTNPLSDGGRTTSIVTSTTDLGNMVAEAYVYNSSGSRCTYGMSCTSVRLFLKKPSNYGRLFLSSILIKNLHLRIMPFRTATFCSEKNEFCYISYYL